MFHPSVNTAGLHNQTMKASVLWSIVSLASSSAEDTIYHGTLAFIFFLSLEFNADGCGKMGSIFTPRRTLSTFLIQAICRTYFTFDSHTESEKMASYICLPLVHPVPLYILPIQMNICRNGISDQNVMLFLYVRKRNNL